MISSRTRVINFSRENVNTRERVVCFGRFKTILRQYREWYAIDMPQQCFQRVVNGDLQTSLPFRRLYVCRSNEMALLSLLFSNVPSKLLLLGIHSAIASTPRRRAAVLTSKNTSEAACRRRRVFTKWPV